eukprot:352103-Chlamydomonas_euryale.AAC.2
MSYALYDIWFLRVLLPQLAAPERRVRPIRALRSESSLGASSDRKRPLLGRDAGGRALSHRSWSASARRTKPALRPLSALPMRGWGADGPGRGRGRVALSATVARPSRDGSRFRRRSRDAGLGPPAGARDRLATRLGWRAARDRRRPSPGLVGRSAERW